MTDKKENILRVSLELFSNEGFDAVSTNKIAKSAGVSEGLIFKHFTNKKGLLEAIMKDAEVKLAQVLAPIIFEQDPLKTIQEYISLPFNIPENQYNYWKLQFKLKWQEEYNNPDKIKPIKDKLSGSFKALNYPSPELEAEFLILVVEAIAIGILRDGKKAQTKFRDYLINKYN